MVHLIAENTTSGVKLTTVKFNAQGMAESQTLEFTDRSVYWVTSRNDLRV